MTVQEYTRKNTQFEKKLLYCFGYEAGFYSEVNNLLLCVGYCLEKQIQINIFTPYDAVNCVDSGWEDFFLPFCKIIPNRKRVLSYIIKKCNPRQPIGITKKKKLFSNIVKRMLGYSYFTYEVWNEFRNKDYILGDHFINEEKIYGLEYYRVLLTIVYRYNNKLHLDVLNYIERLNLGSNYIAMHIRGGDKINEYNLINIDKYIKYIDPEIKNVFVFTDDYRNVIELRKKCSSFNIITSCKKNETGYTLDKLKQLSRDDLYIEYVKMIASMDVLSNGIKTIGTFTTNPGMFLGMKMPSEKFFDVENLNWFVT